MSTKKHRFYVDVVYSGELSQRKAARGLQLVLDERLDLQKAPIWASDNSPYIDRITVVEIRARRESD